VSTLIGVGGMGEVYRATDTALKRQVAIKVLPEAFVSDAERLARFQREAELLASLNHPNIAIVHGLEKSAGTTALVMELVDGTTLAERIAAGPVPIDEALPIAAQIADALESAHERGIVHRDLKPGNVKVRPDGTVKVLDFGLAKVMEPTAAPPVVSQSPTITTPAMTHTGVILGTAAYMSPEQARGRVVDARADIWAFGAVLFEMLTGRPAFKAESVTDTLAAIVKDEPNWAALPDGVAPGLVWILRWCLEKDLKQRLRDIHDVRLGLDSAYAPASTNPNLFIPTATKSRARLVSLGVIGGLVAGLAIGLAVSTLVARRDDPIPSITRFEVPFRPGQQGGQVAFSSDGETLLYSALGADGRTRLYRRPLDTLAATPISDTEGASDPFLSPDGRWLGFVVGRTLKRVSLSGGASETIAELSVDPDGASWDAESILVGGGSGGVLRVPLAGGEPTVIAAAAEGRQLRDPHVIPGARALLFTESRFSAGVRGADTPELQILELDSGRRRALLQGSAGRLVPTGHIVFERADSLWAVAFDTTRLEVLGSPVPVVQGVSRGVSRFAVTDAGSLAFVPGASMPTRKLVWVDRAGREEAIAAPPRGYTYPRVSPDGTRVAIDVRDESIDIWVWAFDRETLTRLTFDPAQDEYPVWTHDGARILFASFRDKSWGVFSQAADGSGAAQRVGTGLNEIDPLTLSPDSRTMIGRFEGDLVALPLSRSGEATALMQTRFSEPNADISPDGRWIAYQSDESGRAEIYVRPFPAVESGLWQVSTTGGTHPVWAKSGRELFYLASPGLMSIPIQPGASFAFGNPRVVVKNAAYTYWVSSVGRSYDVAPNGERFLMLKEEGQAAAAIHVVKNWGTELGRLLQAH
jgi:eukaryotic-like serine/threonine-protein kinase